MKNGSLKQKQMQLLKKESSSYGGELLKTRKGRSRGRPLDTKNTMHLVLRSSKAKGIWSFKSAKNQKAIERIVQKFSQKYRIQIVSMANVGNHLHFQIKLAKRHTYKPFIRAVTSAMAMAVTGINRWTKTQSLESAQMVGSRGNSGKGKFWDYRPFTRVVQSYKAFLTLKDYILINQLEGYGVRRDRARFLIRNRDYAFNRII